MLSLSSSSFWILFCYNGSKGVRTLHIVNLLLLLLLLIQVILTNKIVVRGQQLHHRINHQAQQQTSDLSTSSSKSNIFNVRINEVAALQVKVEIELMLILPEERNNKSDEVYIHKSFNEANIDEAHKLNRRNQRIKQVSRNEAEVYSYVPEWIVTAEEIPDDLGGQRSDECIDEMEERHMEQVVPLPNVSLSTSSSSWKPSEDCHDNIESKNQYTCQIGASTLWFWIPLLEFAPDLKLNDTTSNGGLGNSNSGTKSTQKYGKNPAKSSCVSLHHHNEHHIQQQRQQTWIVTLWERDGHHRATQHETRILARRLATLPQRQRVESSQFDYRKEQRSRIRTDQSQRRLNPIAKVNLHATTAVTVPQINEYVHSQKDENTPPRSTRTVALKPQMYSAFDEDKLWMCVWSFVSIVSVAWYVVDLRKSCNSARADASKLFLAKHMAAISAQGAYIRQVTRRNDMRNEEADDDEVYDNDPAAAVASNLNRSHGEQKQHQHHEKSQQHELEPLDPPAIVRHRFDPALVLPPDSMKASLTSTDANAMTLKTQGADDDAHPTVPDSNLALSHAKQSDAYRDQVDTVTEGSAPIYSDEPAYPTTVVTRANTIFAVRNGKLCDSYNNQNCIKRSLTQGYERLPLSQLCAPFPSEARTAVSESLPLKSCTTSLLSPQESWRDGVIARPRRFHPDIPQHEPRKDSGVVIATSFVSQTSKVIVRDEKNDATHFPLVGTSLNIASTATLKELNDSSILSLTSSRQNCSQNKSVSHTMAISSELLPTTAKTSKNDKSITIKKKQDAAEMESQLASAGNSLFCDDSRSFKATPVIEQQDSNGLGCFVLTQYSEDVGDYNDDNISASNLGSSGIARSQSPVNQITSCLVSTMCNAKLDDSVFIDEKKSNSRPLGTHTRKYEDKNGERRSDWQKLVQHEWQLANDQRVLQKEPAAETATNDRCQVAHDPPPIRFLQKQTAEAFSMSTVGTNISPRTSVRLQHHLDQQKSDLECKLKSPDSLNLKHKGRVGFGQIVNKTRPSHSSSSLSRQSAIADVTRNSYQKLHDESKSITAYPHDCDSLAKELMNDGVQLVENVTRAQSFGDPQGADSTSQKHVQNDSGCANEHMSIASKPEALKGKSQLQHLEETSSCINEALMLHDVQTQPASCKFDDNTAHLNEPSNNLEETPKRNPEEDAPNSDPHPVLDTRMADSATGYYNKSSDCHLVQQVATDSIGNRETDNLGKKATRNFSEGLMIRERRQFRDQHLEQKVTATLSRTDITPPEIAADQHGLRTSGDYRIDKYNSKSCYKVCDFYKKVDMLPKGKVSQRGDKIRRAELGWGVEDRGTNKSESSLASQIKVASDVNRVTSGRIDALDGNSGSECKETLNIENAAHIHLDSKARPSTILSQPVLKCKEKEQKTTEEASTSDSYVSTLPPDSDCSTTVCDILGFNPDNDSHKTNQLLKTRYQSSTSGIISTRIENHDDLGAADSFEYASCIDIPAAKKSCCRDESREQSNKDTQRRRGRRIGPVQSPLVKERYPSNRGKNKLPGTYTFKKKGFFRTGTRKRPFDLCENDTRQLEATPCALECGDEFFDSPVPPSKKARPFSNSSIVPDWVPSTGLQTASQQFVSDDPWKIKSVSLNKKFSKPTTSIPKSIQVSGRCPH